MRGGGNKFGAIPDDEDRDAGLTMILVIDEFLEADPRGYENYFPLVAMGAAMISLTSMPQPNSKGAAIIAHTLSDPTASLIFLRNYCERCQRSQAHVVDPADARMCPHRVVSQPGWKFGAKELLAIAESFGVGAEVVATELCGTMAESDEQTFFAEPLQAAFGAPVPLPANRKPSHVFIGIDTAEGGRVNGRRNSLYVAVALAVEMRALWIVGVAQIEIDQTRPIQPASLLWRWIETLTRHPSLDRAKFFVAVESNRTLAAGVAMARMDELILAARNTSSARVSAVQQPGYLPGRLHSDDKSKMWGTRVLQLWINKSRALHSDQPASVCVAEKGVHMRFTPEPVRIPPDALCAQLYREFLHFDPKQKSSAGDDHVMAMIIALMGLHTHSTLRAQVLAGYTSVSFVHYRDCSLNMTTDGIGQWHAG